MNFDIFVMNKKKSIMGKAPVITYDFKKITEAKDYTELEAKVAKEGLKKYFFTFDKKVVYEILVKDSNPSAGTSLKECSKELTEEKLKLLENK